MLGMQRLNFSLISLEDPTDETPIDGEGDETDPDTLKCKN